eukprot:EG_transcript_1747
MPGPPPPSPTRSLPRPLSPAPAPGRPHLDGFLLLAQLVSALPVAAVALCDGADPWYVATEGLHSPETLLQSAALRHVLASRSPLLCHDAQTDERVYRDPLMIANPDMGFMLVVPLLLPGAGRCVGCLVAMGSAAPAQAVPHMRQGLEAIAEQVVELYGLFLRAQRMQEVLPLLCHELNTPLNAVLGMSTLSDLAHGSDVVDSATAALRTVEHLKDFVEITQGHLAVDRVLYPLRECLEAAAAQSGPRAAVPADAAPDLAVEGDPRRVRQLLRLLAEAAAEAAPGQGEVQLTATVPDPRPSGSSDVLFEVRAGRPAPVTHAGRLLHAIGLPSPRSSPAGGAQLGLVVARALCDALGGRLWAEGGGGPGVRFAFTLPARVLERRGSRPSLQRSASFSSLSSEGASLNSEGSTADGLGMSVVPLLPTLRVSAPTCFLDGLRPLQLAEEDARLPGLPRTHSVPQVPRRKSVSDLVAPVAPLAILVVDDIPLNVRVLVGFLNRLGYAADTAANGVEALASCEARRYDLVFTDVEMPLLDGVAFVQRLRATDGPQPYVVGVSANTLDATRRQCLAAGMQEFLAKPVRLDAVRQAVEAAARPALAPHGSLRRRRRPSQLGLFDAVPIEGEKDAVCVCTAVLPPGERHIPTPPKPRTTLPGWAAMLFQPRPPPSPTDGSHVPSPPNSTAETRRFPRFRQHRA